MSGLTGRQALGVAGVGIALVVAFAIATGESTVDLQRKPELVDLMLNQSAQTCVIQNDPMDAAPYLDRLKDVLQETRSDTLDYFLANKTTVCLDKRLSQQDNGFLARDAQGIYYPDVNVVSLRDNGNDPSKTGFFDWSAGTYGPRFLNEFKDNFGGYFSAYSSIADVAKPLLAFKYSTSCGKNCTTTRYEWGTEGGWGVPNTLSNKPALYTPPVQTHMPALHLSS